MFADPSLTLGKIVIKKQDQAHPIGTRRGWGPDRPPGASGASGLALSQSGIRDAMKAPTTGDRSILYR